MDIDFVIQDTFALTRPHWKLVGSLEEAGRAFAAAVSQNYKSQEVERTVEPEDADEEDSPGEGPEEDELRVPDMDEAHSSSEELESEVIVSSVQIFSGNLTQGLGFDQRREESRFRL